MFEMKRMGLKLVELRKKYDYTQVEVADKLGVSYQAVSNWERGLSMPDISKLPEIAEMYKITLDELFGNKRMSKVVESAKNDSLEELTKEEPLTIKEVEEISAITKPSQLEELSETVVVEEVEENMLGLLPFVNDETANKIVLDLVNEVEPLELMANSCPFVPSDTLDMIYELAVSKGQSSEEFMNYLPFLSSKTCDEIVLACLEEGKNVEELLSKSAPFISSKAMKKIMEKAINEVGGDTLIRYAPFIGLESMDLIVERMLDKNKDVSKIFESIFPFISRKLVDKIVIKDIEEGKEIKKYISYAPFISQETMSKIVDSL